MARRAPRMPLYEVMRTNARRPAGLDRDQPSGATGLGGVIRLPAPAILLVAAGVVLALIVAYAIGYGLAVRSMDAEADAGLLEAQRLRESAEATEPRPLAASEGAVQRGSTGRGAGPSRRGAGGTATPAVPEIVMGDSGPPGNDPRAGDGAGEAADAWFQREPADLSGLPVVLDPRPEVDGPWFWALVTTYRDRAEEVVGFLRANGLEAYAFPSNNAGLDYRVTVLPGLATNDPADLRVQAMRRAIEDLDRAFEREFGAKAFESALLMKY